MKLNLDPQQFSHPLVAESTTVELEDGTIEEVYNLRTASTVGCYIAANDPNNHTANRNIETLVSVEDPLIDVKGLISAVRTGDRAATLRLIALVEGGLSKLADKAFEEKNI